ncbi:hypothetical protein AVEN_31254-1 [Araneus ventricosus]|uniref:Uncharacterized protein n=1 Tax=Araneus ventricosus TaxID=182803 RepID=A0A4Y2IK29_ARAVE|nr:hypothetical protein AVEN_31254-1 [Araneus ventricosus]
MCESVALEVLCFVFSFSWKTSKTFLFPWSEVWGSLPTPHLPSWDCKKSLFVRWFDRPGEISGIKGIDRRRSQYSFFALECTIGRRVSPVAHT